jgi:hypothetical protein
MLEIIFSKNPENLYIDNGLRSVTVSFTLSSNFSKYYFYVYSVFEFPTFGGILTGESDVIPFLVNVYDFAEGKSIYSLDILRIIFTVVIFFITFFNFKETKESMSEESQENSIENIKILFSPKILFNILIIILFVIVIIYKFINLSKNINDISLSTYKDGYIELFPYDMYYILSDFEKLILIETLLLISLFTRILLMFFGIERIKIFLDYILISARKVLAFLLILVFILLSMAIFANNLWGEYINEYKDFSSSILNILLFSIGHYRNISLNGFQFWNIIFNLLFFLLIIYFFLSTFIGIYLEAYRMNSLLIGYSYDARFLNNTLLVDLEKSNDYKD